MKKHLTLAVIMITYFAIFIFYTRNALPNNGSQQVNKSKLMVDEQEEKLRSKWKQKFELNQVQVNWLFPDKILQNLDVLTEMIADSSEEYIRRRNDLFFIFSPAEILSELSENNKSPIHVTEFWERVKKEGLRVRYYAEVVVTDETPHQSYLVECELTYRSPSDFEIAFLSSSPDFYLMTQPMYFNGFIISVKHDSIKYQNSHWNNYDQEVTDFDTDPSLYPEGTGRDLLSSAQWLYNLRFNNISDRSLELKGESAQSKWINRNGSRFALINTGKANTLKLVRTWQNEKITFESRDMLDKNKLKKHVVYHNNEICDVIELQQTHKQYLPSKIRRWFSGETFLGSIVIHDIKFLSELDSTENRFPEYSFSILKEYNNRVSEFWNGRTGGSKSEKLKKLKANIIAILPAGQNDVSYGEIDLLSKCIHLQIMSNDLEGIQESTARLIEISKLIDVPHFMKHYLASAHKKALSYNYTELATFLKNKNNDFLKVLNK